ncbi:hypothetical protein Tco_1306119, partial [Tanacetum coccineum]
HLKSHIATTFTTIPSDNSTPSRATCRWGYQSGLHVARDKLKEKAGQGYFPERLGGARIVSGKLLSVTVDDFPGKVV